MNKLVKNQIYQGVVTGYTSEGDGVARVNDSVVFIPSVAVGDECTFKMLKVGKNVSFAKLEEIITPSENRVTPECEISDKCGGCSFFHINYAEELRMKKEKVEMAFRKIGGINIDDLEIVGSDNVHSYRNKAQYPLALTNSYTTAFGFYRKHSNDVVPCKRCHITPQIFDEITAEMCDIMDQLQIRPYDKNTMSGTVRHIYLRASSDNSQILLTLISTSNLNKYKDFFIERLTEKFPQICGIVCNINRDKTNKILGEKYVTLFGQDYLEDEMCGNKFKLSPAAFYQVNHDSAEKLYNTAIEFADLKGDENIVELYSGAGTITLAMARKAGEVYAIDIVPQAIENAKENAELNEIENVQFICADAGQGALRLMEEGVEADVVVVDPPRRGLDEVSVEAIIALGAPKVVYVSCDPATLARDIKILSQNGYKLLKYKAFDLFPRTHHVECVTLLIKE